MKQLKRKRKSNYSVRETQTLIREIHKRQDVLFSRQQNTAINELKRQAWEEVAGGVNALGEGELRTAAEVKRRYLDWRALMKRKQLRAELSVCLSSSSASSLALKEEYESCSPEHDAAMLGTACELLDLSGFPKDHHCSWPELVALGEPGGHMMMMANAASGVKMEEDASEYRTDSDRDVADGDGDGELDEDDFPSLLGEMASRGEVCVPEAYCHIDELGALASSSSSSKAPTSTTPTPNASISTTHRDFPPLALGGALAGLDGAPPPQGEAAAAAVLAAVETQRLELERQRLAVETERLAVEREQLAVQRERLQTERERCRLEQERLRALLLGQARRAAEEPAQQGTPSSSTAPDGRQELAGADEGEGRGSGWRSSAAVAASAELEMERLKLDKERLQLEKERLQFFKFESGRLQIERERLQVDKERMLLLKDHH